MSRKPHLSGVVVHWGDPRELVELVEAWPEDRRFELVVVDNGPAEGGETAGGRALGEGVWDEVERKGRVVRTGRNLGFGGGVNAGVQEARGEGVLILNPDAVPEPGALEEVVDGLAAHPEAAGVVPRMVGRDGRVQFAWQLRRLPSAGQLLLQAAGWPTAPEAREEPAAGEAVEQPAAAALALRREALERVGGFDDGFHPAWFEDVDLAKRLEEAGLELVYWPRATVRHGLGGTVGQLGYGRFLWTYQRNLVRYLGKHHGRTAATLARLLVPLGLLLRLALLPLRKPERAASRRAAAGGLLGALAGALTGWRRPRRWSGGKTDDQDRREEERTTRPTAGPPPPGAGSGPERTTPPPPETGPEEPEDDLPTRDGTGGHGEAGADWRSGARPGGSSGESWAQGPEGRDPQRGAIPGTVETGSAETGSAGTGRDGHPAGGNGGRADAGAAGGEGVAVCVVTRDSEGDVAPCFAGVAALHHRPLAVVLVDCDSRDGTVAAAERHRGVLEAAGVPLHLHPLGENRGFAGGMNAAVDLADRLFGAPWVLSLNADARPAPDYLERLLARAAAHPELKVGALTGRLTRLPEAPPVLDACGMRLTRTWRHMDRGSGEPDRGQYDRPERVFGATGAASLFRRGALDDAALEGDAFDPLFHSFREDAELAFRLRERGWEVLYEPTARAGHRRFNLPERRRTMPPAVNRHSLKNRYLLRLYHQTPRNLLTTLVPTLIRDLAALAWVLLRERSSLGAYGWLWRHRREVLARRRAIQRRRTVPARDLDRWFGREGMPL